MLRNFQNSENKVDALHKILLLFLVAVYSSFMSAVSIFRHYAFQSHADLGGYEQIVWNTVNGNFLKNTIHPSVFQSGVMLSGGDPSNVFIPSLFSNFHLNPIILVFAPVYAVFPYTETLLISQSIVLGLGAIPIYFLAKLVIKNRLLSMVIAASYLLYPGLNGANVMDFNYLSFAVPLLLSAFYFYKKQRFFLYWLCIGLAILTREEVSLAILFFGLFVMMFQKKYRVGLITTALGASWFIVAIQVMLPIFTGPTHFAGYYASLLQGSEGGIISGLVTGFINNPDVVIERIFSIDSTIYAIQIFGPTGFLSILSPSYFLISFPDFIKNILSDFVQTRLMWQHYQLLLIPGVFFSTIFSLKKIISKNRWNRKYTVLVLVIFLLFFSIVANMLMSPTPLKTLKFYNFGLIDPKIDERRIVVIEFFSAICCGDYGSISYPLNKYQDQILSANKAISLIPEKSSVSAQEVFISHTIKNESYIFPAKFNEVDYILVMDSSEIYLTTWPIQEDTQNFYLTELRNDSRYQLIFNENHILLFERIN